MAARIAASATVRAVKGRKLIPTRAALVLVRNLVCFNCLSVAVKYEKCIKSVLIENLISLYCFQTPSAVTRIKELFKDNDYAGLKIGVRQRGCNGLSYTLDYASKKDKFDVEVVQDGVRVFVDMKAQLSLLGTEMDYVVNELSSEFVFNNPNVKGTCGCGESFSI